MDRWTVTCCIASMVIVFLVMTAVESPWMGALVGGVIGFVVSGLVGIVADRGRPRR